MVTKQLMLIVNNVAKLSKREKNKMYFVSKVGEEWAAERS